MEPFVVIQAEERDLQQILQLQYLAYQSEAALCGTQDIPPLKQTLQEVQEEYHCGVILKAEDGPRIIGSVRVRREGGTALIGKLMVHPAYRRQGLGTRLLQAAEACFPGCRYELFTSTVSEENIRLYRRQGYREYKQVRVNDRLTLVYLQKAGIVTER